MVLVVVGVGNAACASHNVGLCLGIMGVFAGLVFGVRHEVVVVVRLAIVEVFGVVALIVLLVKLLVGLVVLVVVEDEMVVLIVVDVKLLVLMIVGD